MSKKEPGKKAVVLLSGGLDSAVCLYLAKKEGYDVFCLSFDYGQKHRKEINLAEKIAKNIGCKWNKAEIKLPWKGSALLDKGLTIPRYGKINSGIPSTYVPSRNIIFLSFAASYAEVIGADCVFIGANQIDFSGYPDCRGKFLRAFERMLAQGTKAGTEGRNIKIKAPLLNKNKAQIVNLGMRLNVPFSLTWSCYEGRAKACGKCDSCHLRSQGFRVAGVEDPAR